MNCPNCQTSNLENANFCSNCGHALANLCPNCGEKNSQEANFCSNCGAQLPAGEASIDSSEEKLIQYVPKELLKKIEAARSGRKMAGERRVVTILFCDVKGSTAAAEQMDPEDWAEIMNRTFDYLIRPVYRYEGMLARLMGDAVLAFFGAPIAHEDDSERAVLAGLEIVRGIKPYRQEVQESWGFDFNVRVGINTGLVVVGEVGSDLRLEYTAMGDAVNLAARMEQTAEPGTVQIAHETYVRVAPLFELDPLGEIKVKGKKGTVLAYRVTDRKSHPERLRGIEGQESPLVGRESEIAILQESLSQLEKGQGGIVCLIGEAGLGKSRVIDEIHRKWIGEGYWAESRGISYDTTHPYSQFQQHFRQLFDITETDKPEHIRDKLAEAVLDLAQDEQDAADQALQVMFAIEQVKEGSGLEGEALKRQLLNTSLSVWRRSAERNPMVLVFDDLHWADSASTELLTNLFQLTDEAPILFLCAFRPDRLAPSWRMKQAAETEYPHRYIELVLEPLSFGHSKELVDNLLSIKELPEGLHKLIQEKAEGNPFFVEEVVRTLIDSGAIIRDADGTRMSPGTNIEDIAIPDNVQSMLIARIDRLDDDVRQTLQLASVIGRRFFYRVLQAISEAAEKLDHHLSSLQRFELIRQAARDPELEYAFRHALTQEATYRSILRRERREFHLRVGEALEHLYSERKDELAALLAYHFLQAEDDRGVDYAVLAGDEAFRMYAIDAAIEHYRQALDADPTQDPQLLKHLFTRLGRSHELVDTFDKALLVYQEMRSTARELSDGEMELAAITESAKIRSTLNVMYDADKARMLSDEALALARELGNPEAEARISWNRSNTETFVPDIERAIEFGKQSVAIAEQYNLREQLAFSLNDLTRPLMFGGEPQRAMEMNLKARELWLELENLPMLGDNYAAGAFIKYWLGRYEEAIDEAEQSYQITKSIDNKWGQSTSRIWLGFTYLDQGRFELTIETLSDGLYLALEADAGLSVMMCGALMGMAYSNLGRIDQAFAALEKNKAFDRVQFPHTWRPIADSTLSRLHLMRGDLREARRLSQASYQDLRLVGSVNAADFVFVVDAEVALAENEPNRAVELMDELLRLAEQAQRRPAVSEALLVQGRAFRVLGNHEGAQASLLRALTEAKELGAKRVIWQILLELGRFENDAANKAEARMFYAQAAAAVSELAESIEDVELRRSFESLPDVKEALGS